MRINQQMAGSPNAQTVLEFWLRDALSMGWPSESLNDLWWGGGPERDRDVDSRFGPLVRDAVNGGLGDWETQALDRLALVILLDQFTRNVFRGKRQAFAGDGRAQALVTEALALAWDEKMPLAGRAFFYMPLIHSENMTLQDEGLRCFKLLLERADTDRKQDLQGFLKSAQQHREIVATFGRFPHRNAALGRTDSTREQEYLQHGPRFGQ